MDQQFKIIIQKTKAWDQGTDPLAHTFEGAIFKDSYWPFIFNNSIKTEPLDTKSLIPLVQPKTPSKTDSLPKVLFVGDSFVKGEDLLGKMIIAMKLLPGEFNRFSFNEKLEEVTDLAENLISPTFETTELLEQIRKYKPTVVVALGAIVTNILLGKAEKLSGIHGQFFEKSLSLNNDSYTYQLMPIFHPDFLLINPNMKRTAWNDLQKVMALVGKI